MPEHPHSGPTAPEPVERFVKQLNIAFKAVKLYPLSSNIPRDSARAALDTLRQILQRSPEARIDVAKDGLLYESLPIFPGHPAFASFAREFYNRGLAEVRFHAGTTIDELLRFLSVLDVPVSEIVSSGGFEDRLWHLGVNNVAVKEVSTRIVETTGEETEETAEEEWPPLAALIDDLLAESGGRRPRAQRLLARVMSTADVLDTFLASPADGEGATPRVASRRLVELAHAAQAEEGVTRAELYRALADAARRLGPAVLRQILVHMSAESRRDEAVRGVLENVPLEELAGSLVTAFPADEAGRTELTRSVRELVGLALAPRDATMAAVADALAAAGAPDELCRALLEEVAPSRLRISERPQAAEAPAVAVLRLLGIPFGRPDDTASAERATALARQAAAELADEAARGITDGDVFGALVTLVTLEERPEPFASIVSMLENNVGLLIERHDFDVAADAAEALVQAEQREELTPEQRQRLHTVLTQLAGREQMRIVTGALRLYPAATAEHDACRRLMRILGENTILPLLEVLADEKDMASRKAIVDMVSAMADRFIPDLGSRVDDPRWYFVRNVVSILASTRSPKALPHLGRTLRHPDARVRRETIRAVSSIPDALAGEMLVAALADDDAGNVQLAARYLGSMKVRAALPALQEVARGDGRGNRDVETRVEAIEALGRIGSPEAVPTLEQIARQRSLRMGRARELRTAAAGALAAIKAGGGGAR